MKTKVFKPGDIVQFANGGHVSNPDGFVVMHESLQDAAVKKWGAAGPVKGKHVWVVGLNDGNSYSPQIDFMLHCDRIKGIPKAIIAKDAIKDDIPF